MGGDEAVPGYYTALPLGRQPPEPSFDGPVERDGRSWRLGTWADAGWIGNRDRLGPAVSTAVPPLFPAYASVVLPFEREDEPAHDDALLSVLRAHASTDEWWLGYLDTGADDVVFPDARRTRLYWDWGYVLVLAGPDQAATWRPSNPQDPGMHLPLPELMFPTDRSWLLSTLWDDWWTCIGGSETLVKDLLTHPTLRDRSRRVRVDEDASWPPPPGF